MRIQESIEVKLQALAPAHLSVENESGMHNVPAGSETHFNVTLVSDQFAGQSRVQRHRAVNRLLAEQLAGPVHALAIHAFTPDEWAARGQSRTASPDCLGGRAKEAGGR